jgi:hypothetical protein
MRWGDLPYDGNEYTKIGYAMKAPSSSYNSNYNETEYEALNQVDIRLYEYAQELRRVDCDFFLRLKDRIMATVHGYSASRSKYLLNDI